MEGLEVVGLVENEVGVADTWGKSLVNERVVTEVEMVGFKMKVFREGGPIVDFELINASNSPGCYGSKMNITRELEKLRIIGNGKGFKAVLE